MHNGAKVFIITKGHDLSASHEPSLSSSEYLALMFCRSIAYISQ
jgi:hypothetical protein